MLTAADIYRMMRTKCDRINTEISNLDEPIVLTEKTIELVDSLVVEDAPKITIVEKDKHKAHIKDFVPVLFFICITIVIIAAGYYFLNNVDLMGLIS